MELNRNLRPLFHKWYPFRLRLTSVQIQPRLEQPGTSHFQIKLKETNFNFVLLGAT